MKVAISQPTYLPWMGYFDVIDQVDTFVVLDNVQFAKRSWQQRNRIRTATGLQWLTVPVKSQGRFEQLIRDVELLDVSFARDHVRAIEHAYRRAPHFQQYFPGLEQQLTENCPVRLAELNTRLLKCLMSVLGLETPIVNASELGVSGRRTEQLANICEKLGADEYLSALGSAAYLVEDQEIFTSRSIEVTFQHYEHPVYPQVFLPFEPFASVIDLIFNTGEASLEVLRSGRRKSYSLGEAQQLLQTPAPAAVASEQPTFQQ